MKAYYFTEARWAIDNIRRRRIKVSLLSELNDPFELLALNLTELTHRPAYFDAIEYCQKRYGVLCLSRSFSNPLLWGHYGDRHRGMCLGFDINDALMMPISYEVDRLRLEIQRAVETGGVESVLHRVFSTKFVDWRYEEEVRAWINLEERDEETGFFFAEFGPHLRLREVILGVRCQASIDNVRAATSFFDDLKIYCARLSTESFRIEKSDGAGGEPDSAFSRPRLE